jgi:hypothetical protein
LFSSFALVFYFKEETSIAQKPTPEIQAEAILIALTSGLRAEPLKE